MKKFLAKISAFFRRFFSKIEVPEELEDVIPSVALGKVSIEGSEWLRSGKKIKWKAIAYDMFNQPVEDKGCFDRLDQFAKDGINLIVTYAGPGLGKPLNAPNEGGSPYSNVAMLTRNGAYWDHAKRRLEYANKKGITVLCSFSFQDQGMLSQRRVDQGRLDKEIQKWAEDLDPYSVMLSPVSEADEGGSSALERTLFLLSLVRQRSTAPLGFHTTSNNGKYAVAVNFISVQDNGSIDWGRIQRLTGHGKPVMIVENQDTNAAQQIENHKRASSLGVTFCFTGFSRGLDRSIVRYLKKV